MLRIDVKNLRRETARFVGEKKENGRSFSFVFPSLLSFYTHHAPFSSNVFVDGRNVSCRPREIYDETEPAGCTYPLAKTHHVTPLSRSCMSPVVSVICLHGLCSSCNFKGNGLFRVASEETRLSLTPRIEIEMGTCGGGYVM